MAPPYPAAFSSTGKRGPIIEACAIRCRPAVAGTNDRQAAEGCWNAAIGADYLQILFRHLQLVARLDGFHGQGDLDSRDG